MNLKEGCVWPAESYNRPIAHSQRSHAPTVSVGESFRSSEKKRGQLWATVYPEG